MRYPDTPIQSRRGVAFCETVTLDFSGLDPRAPGALLTLHVRAAAGDAAVALELRSDRDDGIMVAAAGGTLYAITLRAPKGAMSALRAGVYAYGLLVSGAGADPEPALDEVIIMDGRWTHDDVLVTRT